MLDGKIEYQAALAGSAGNSIRVWHKAGGGTAIGVDVVGNDITVSLLMAGTSVACTARQVAAAVNMDSVASTLVRALVMGTGNGLASVTSGFVPLVGGQDDFTDSEYVELEGALDRVLARLKQVEPAHAELVVLFRTSLRATMFLTATVEPTMT